MSSKSRIASSLLLALLLAVSASACADGDDRSNGELGQRIANPTTLTISSHSSAAITGHDSTGAEVSVGPLVIQGGDITVQRNDDGDIVVQSFVVHLGDIVADDGTLAGHPRTLTSVKVSLGRQIVLRDAWSLNGMGARAVALTDVRLDWAMVGDGGQPMPLGTHTFANAQVFILLHAEDDGSVSARLDTHLDGSLLADWGVELSDFSMQVSASDGP